MNNILIFVLGPTGTGKSTFLQACLAAMPDRVGLVEVGKEMRKRHPPEYFKGSAAPDHTQAEVEKLCYEGVTKHQLDGKSIILVDGQPRRTDHCAKLLKFAKELAGWHSLFVNLYTPTATRKERLDILHKDNPGNMDLAMARLTGDLPALYEVISMISITCPMCLYTYDTTCPGYDPVKVLNMLTQPSVWKIPELPNASDTPHS